MNAFSRPFAATMWRVKRRALLAFGLAWALGACSADSVPVPEPTLDTKGAFVAVAADGDDYELYRILTVLGTGRDDDVFFVAPFVVRPKSFDEARELAKDPAQPTLQVTAVGRLYFTSRDWRVVWFRSVSPEETAGFR